MSNLTWTEDKGTKTSARGQVWRAATPGVAWAIGSYPGSGYVLSANSEVIDSGRTGTYKFRTWSDAAKIAESHNESRQS